jgi:hypothetical protein
MWNSLGSTPEFDGDDAAGLWMSTNDARSSSGEDPGQPPTLDFVPPSRPIPPSARPGPIGEPGEPEASLVAFPVLGEAVVAETVVTPFPVQGEVVAMAPPEPEPVPVESEPAAIEPAPAATAEPFEPGATPTQTVAAGDDGLGDALSMFREVSTGSDFQHFTAEIEDIPAQELLTDARAVLDLVGGPVPATE